MLGNLTGWHLLIILAVVLLIFGAAKLPALAKSMGQSARILKSEIATGKAESAAASAPSALEPDAPYATASVTPDVSVAQSVPTDVSDKP